MGVDSTPTPRPTLAHLVRIDPQEVSLVDHPGNRRTFVVRRDLPEGAEVAEGTEAPAEERELVKRMAVVGVARLDLHGLTVEDWSAALVAGVRAAKSDFGTNYEYDLYVEAVRDGEVAVYSWADEQTYVATFTSALVDGDIVFEFSDIEVGLLWFARASEVQRAADPAEVDPEAGPTLAERVEALAATVESFGDLPAALAELRTTVAPLADLISGQTALRGDVDGLAPRLEALASLPEQLTALSEQVAGLTDLPDRVTRAEGRPDVEATVTAAVEPLTERLVAVETGLAAVRARPAPSQTDTPTPAAPAAPAAGGNRPLNLFNGLNRGP